MELGPRHEKYATLVEMGFPTRVLEGLSFTKGDLHSIYEQTIVSKYKEEICKGELMHRSKIFFFFLSTSPGGTNIVEYLSSNPVIYLNAWKNTAGSQ